LAISVRELSNMLSMHPETIRRHVRSGRLPAIRLGGEIRIARDVVNRLLTGDLSLKVLAHRRVPGK
jgi:excisionase family DNA binding protein